MKTKYFVLKNGCILRSYLSKSLALSFFSDLLLSSDLEFDVVEFWHGDSCLLVNSL